MARPTSPHPEARTLTGAELARARRRLLAAVRTAHRQVSRRGTDTDVRVWALLVRRLMDLDGLCLPPGSTTVADLRARSAAGDAQAAELLEALGEPAAPALPPELQAQVDAVHARGPVGWDAAELARWGLRRGVPMPRCVICTATVGDGEPWWRCANRCNRIDGELAALQAVKAQLDGVTPTPRPPAC